jgi:rod shape-determining protein MreD
MRQAIRSDREERVARLRGQVLPAISTVLGSAVTLLPIVAAAPILPPFGLLMLLSWRLIRPELWPIWVGIPLGLVDDLLSGQPIGSAVLLWTLVLLGIDQLDRRTMFRDYWQDWLIAAVAIIVCLAGGLLTANLTGGHTEFAVIVPQIMFSVLAYPIVARFCALLDRWRLS